MIWASDASDEFEDFRKEGAILTSDEESNEISIKFNAPITVVFLTAEDLETEGELQLTIDGKEIDLNVNNDDGKINNVKFNSKLAGKYSIFISQITVCAKTPNSLNLRIV